MSRVSISGCRQVWLLPLGREQLRRALHAMLDSAQEPDMRVELCLVRDGAMAQLNRLHLGCAGPTNVLAFPADGKDAGQGPAPVPQAACGRKDFLGSLVLCADAARREALLYGQPEPEYCLRLLAHGMAHLMGYDHGPQMDLLCEELLSCAT